MATWPAPSVDDDGTGTTGTILNDAFFDAIKLYIDDSNTAPPISIVNGGSNVFDVTLPAPSPFSYVRLAPASAALTIRSITPARYGDQVLIENVSLTFPAWLSHLAAGSSSLYNRVSSGPTPLAFLGSALYIYETGNYWALAQHDQGKPIRVPFSAGNFVVQSGGGTWTVASGNVSAHDYLLRDNTLMLWVYVSGATIGGTVNHVTVGGWPFNFGQTQVVASYGVGSATGNMLTTSVNPATNVINFLPLSGGSFTAGAGGAIGAQFTAVCT